MCKGHLESTAHALLDCKIARKVWRNSPLGNAVQGDKFPDIVSLLYYLPQQHSDLKGELVATLLWVIWSARNKLLFKGVKENPAVLVARATSVVDSIKRIKQPEHEFFAGRITTKQNQWCPPEDGWLKINVDAAWIERIG